MIVVKFNNFNLLNTVGTEYKTEVHNFARSLQSFGSYLGNNNNNGGRHVTKTFLKR